MSEIKSKGLNDWSEESVSTLKGVGPKLQEKLEHLGIYTKQHMLFHLPLRYEDRTSIHPIGSVQPGQPSLIEGEVLHTGINFRGRRTMMVKLSDGTGTIQLRFFHFNAGQQKRLTAGTWLRCFGEPRLVMGGIEIIHPEYEVIDSLNPPPLNRTLTPIYPTTDGLHQLGLRKIMAQLISQLKEKGLTEMLPIDWLQKNGLPSMKEALLILHHPLSKHDVLLIQSIQHPAQRRFIIEELAAHRIILLQRRERISKQKFPEINSKTSWLKQFERNLDYQLTNAQQRVISELIGDYSLNQPMMRLLQGDVGSGKTVVSAMAAIPVIASGYQCALMAPTEILAEQHFKNFSDWFESLDIQVISLMGADKGKKRQQKEQAIESGTVQMIIGTHALFQQAVKFHALGLMIIDEQHRFGVEQRLALQKKAATNRVPHQLIMTATPIPRTLAMSVYADLSYSQIDELPPGRTPVKTSIVSESQREKLIDSVKKACEQGQQIYWVCTLIEESEALQCEAAEKTFESLKELLPQVDIGIVHGRMKSIEKEEVIKAFKHTQIQLLVATTVIEVGVDVPNASIMIIENPERLGLSQIHQLRGRVGRGNIESFCILLVKNNISKQVSQRLEIIRNHQDGFVIAEKDLEIRGAGEVLGTRQTGEASFKMTNLVRDKAMLPDAKNLAEILRDKKYKRECKQLLANWIGNRGEYSSVG